MIKQYLNKRRKIFFGYLNTYLRKRGNNYNDGEWWDNSFYTGGVSDRKTLSSKKNELSSKYHYGSVESIILKYLFNNSIELDNSSVLDIGSGSGHWINFYNSIGVSNITGLDVSKKSVDFLKARCVSLSHLKIIHGNVIEALKDSNEKYDIINAIGVIFHIVNDVEWKETINKLVQLLSKKGVLIISGHFGLSNRLNVQIDKNNQINKRLRSKRNWKSTLKKAELKNTKFIKNNSYLWIKDSLPENNILIAKY